MKKLILLFFLIFLLAGCTDKTSNEEEKYQKNIHLSITNGVTSLGAIGENLQKLTYELTMTKNKELNIKADSIEIVLNDLKDSKVMNDEITNVEIKEDMIIVKGYIIFESKNLIKKDVIDSEPLIDGFNITTDSKEKIFVKYNIQKEQF